MKKIQVTPMVEVREEDEGLSASKYAEYFEAIVANDAAFVDHFLSSASSDERLRLVNTRFELRDVECPFFRKEISSADVAVTLPLHVAVTNSSLAAARVLVKHGADWFSCDEKGNNILHACVVTSVYFPNLESELVATMEELIEDELTHDEFKQLMLQENEDRFRPSEFAFQQETMKIGDALFWKIQERNCRHEKHGMTSFRWFDVTEYETTRHFRSPLVLMTYLSRDKAMDMRKLILQCPLISRWICLKFRVNMFPIFIWFLMRLSLVLVTMATDRADHQFDTMLDTMSGNETE